MKWVKKKVQDLSRMKLNMEEQRCQSSNQNIHKIHRSIIPSKNLFIDIPVRKPMHYNGGSPILNNLRETQIITNFIIQRLRLKDHQRWRSIHKLFTWIKCLSQPKGRTLLKDAYPKSNSKYNLKCDTSIHWGGSLRGLIHPRPLYNFKSYDITIQYIISQVEGAPLGGISSLDEPK